MKLVEDDEACPVEHLQTYWRIPLLMLKTLTNTVCSVSWCCMKCEHIYIVFHFSCSVECECTINLCFTDEYQLLTSIGIYCFLFVSLFIILVLLILLILLVFQFTITSEIVNEFHIWQVSLDKLSVHHKASTYTGQYKTERHRQTSMP